MTISIVMETPHYAALRAHLLQDRRREHAAFLYGGFARWAGGCKFLVREALPVPADGFLEQDAGRLVIAPAFFNSVMKRARTEQLSVMLTHSHPDATGWVGYSPIDDAGEQAIFENLYRRVPDQPHASMVFGRDAVAARAWLPDGTSTPVDRLVLVGERLDITSLRGNTIALDELHSRQALAFGAAGQARIAASACAVVGAGGTGSVTAEQLIRLGVRRLLVIDDDVMERSNISRVYGSRALDADWALPKVAVLQRLAADIGVGTEVIPIRGSIIDREVALRLREADVVFCCTDSHWSRAVLNQYTDQYLTPVVDMGNRIDAADNVITAAAGRVYIVRPGQPCLWCCNAIQATAVTAEALPAEERERQAAEGYVRGLDVKDPSVISLNTVVAGLAVTEFLELVTGFMGRQGPQAQLNYRILSNTVSAAAYSQDPACDCATGRVRARGDLEALPWRS